MKKWNIPDSVRRITAAGLLSTHLCAISAVVESPEKKGDRPTAGYVARQENMRSFFSGVSSYLNKPIIVSKLAAAKQISGEFDLAAGDIISEVTRQLSLITYYDGNAIYVYDAAETKNSVVKLKNIAFKALIGFLHKSGLADPRYPLRSDGSDTFYVAGPPVYVDLVIHTAEFMDSQSADLDNQRVEVIKLNNTFVTDRAYTRRDEDVVIPGIATVVEKLLDGDTAVAAPVVQKTTAGSGLLDAPIDRTAIPEPVTPAPAATASVKQAGKLHIIAYPDTNSLLVKGTVEQVKFIRHLVEALDEEKRHVELALWIIDIEKDDLDQLGVNWQGAVNIGKQFGVGVNSGSALNAFSTLEGSRFVASIMALARDNKAQIVSRPVVLTQENTPAMFDNNRTFYTKLLAERFANLEEVTYGTLIHVLPRFTSNDEIELSLNIEDGSEVRRDDSDSTSIPTIGRTKISTVARVPKGKSLLVGGYTRGESGEYVGKVPLLGDLPFIGRAFRYRQSVNKNTIRVFLIRPREITDGLDVQADNLDESIEIETLIKRMDNTRDLVRRQQGNLFNGS